MAEMDNKSRRFNRDITFNKSSTGFLLLFIIFILGIGFPDISFASIYINEIAWMGTKNSANDEWIELYNSGNEEVSLLGWTLKSDDKTPTVNLSGTIKPLGYYLMERTSDAVLPDLPADLIYTGALSNTGENLSLINASSSEMHKVDATSGWMAGDNVLKLTMQYVQDRNSWITATGTPKEKNSSVAFSTTTPIVDHSNNEIVETPETQTNQESITRESHTSSEVKEFQVSAGRKRVVPLGNEVHFKANLVKFSGISKENISYIWNMGDGSVKEGREIVHSYPFDGEYIIILNAYSGSSVAVARTEVSVYLPKVEIAQSDEFGVSVMNSLKLDMNLTGWKMKDDKGKYFTFPMDTIIAGNQAIKFSTQVLGINTEGLVGLLNPQGKTIYEKNINGKLNAKSLSDETSKEKVLVGQVELLKKIEETILLLKKDIIAIQNKKSGSNTGDAVRKVVIKENINEEVKIKNRILQETKTTSRANLKLTQTANVVSLYQESKPTFLQTLLYFPSKGVDAFINIFN